MSKKGFTLIELLAVISILALIAMVVFPAVNSSIKKAKEDAYKEQLAIIEKAAKEWALDNADKPEALPDMVEHSENTKVDLSTLVDEGYITEDKVVDPRNGEPLKGYVVISYSSNQYVYWYEEDSDNLKTGG